MNVDWRNAFGILMCREIYAMAQARGYAMVRHRLALAEFDLEVFFLWCFTDWVQEPLCEPWVMILCMYKRFTSSVVFTTDLFWGGVSGVVCSLSCLVAACSWILSCFALFVVLLSCLVDPIWYCYHLLGKRGLILCISLVCVVFTFMICFLWCRW